MMQHQALNLYVNIWSSELGEKVLLMAFRWRHGTSETEGVWQRWSRRSGDSWRRLHASRPRFHVLFLVFLKGLQTIMDHTVMDLYMNLLDTFSYPLENTAHSCFVPIVFGSQGRFGRTCSITPPSSRRSTTPSGRHSSSATGVVQLTGQPLGKLRRSWSTHSMW